MAVIAKQRYKLDIAPKGGWVIVYASQHDNGAREIEFEITNQGNAYSIPASINISVQGVKSNSGYFSHSCSYSGNIVKMALANDMTDVIGKAICVLKFTNSSQQKLATAKFILNVDSDSSSEGVIIDTEAEEIFNQMLDEIRAQAASISADIAELQSMVGSPLVASTASGMTDHNKIYVYTGSESGYTNGNWYYWNGSAWNSGGVYNSIAVNIDSVPTAGSTNPVQSGGVKSALDGLQAEIPAVDSTPTQGSTNAVSSGGVYSEIQTLGDTMDGEISDLETAIAQIVPGLSSEAKNALLVCFQHVVWIDEHGQTYYDALYNALYDGDYVYEWHANSGLIPQGLTYSSVEWGTNNEYLKVYDGNLFLGYANNMTVELEVAFDAPYDTSHGITVADRVNHGARLYTKSDGTLRFVGSENGQTSGIDVVGVDSSIFHKIKIELQNGVASLYVDDVFIASRNAYSSVYLRRPILNSSPISTETGFSKRIKSIKFTRDKNAVLEDKIKVFFGKGTSGSNIVDNTKRFLTEPILFDTNRQLTVQYSGCAAYNVRYAVKIVDNQGNIWVYNSSTDEYNIFWRKKDDITVQADDVYEGWIISDSGIVSGKRVDDVQYIYEEARILNTNGSVRILFADIDSLDNTPEYNIGGTLVIQGRSYILEGRDKNEFV